MPEQNSLLSSLRSWALSGTGSSDSSNKGGSDSSISDKLRGFVDKVDATPTAEKIKDVGSEVYKTVNQNIPGWLNKLLPEESLQLKTQRLANWIYNRPLSQMLTTELRSPRNQALLGGAGVATVGAGLLAYLALRAKKGPEDREPEESETDTQESAMKSASVLDFPLGVSILVDRFQKLAGAAPVYPEGVEPTYPGFDWVSRAVPLPDSAYTSEDDLRQARALREDMGRNPTRYDELYRPRFTDDELDVDFDSLLKDMYADPNVSKYRNQTRNRLQNMSPQDRRDAQIHLPTDQRDPERRFAYYPFANRFLQAAGLSDYAPAAPTMGPNAQPVPFLPRPQDSFEKQIIPGVTPAPTTAFGMRLHPSANAVPKNYFSSVDSSNVDKQVSDVLDRHLNQNNPEVTAQLEAEKILNNRLNPTNPTDTAQGPGFFEQYKWPLLAAGVGLPAAYMLGRHAARKRREEEEEREIQRTARMRRAMAV